MPVYIISSPARRERWKPILSVNWTCGIRELLLTLASIIKQNHTMRSMQSQRTRIHMSLSPLTWPTTRPKKNKDVKKQPDTPRRGVRGGCPFPEINTTHARQKKRGRQNPTGRTQPGCARRTPIPKRRLDANPHNNSQCYSQGGGRGDPPQTRRALRMLTPGGRGGPPPPTPPTQNLL